MVEPVEPVEQGSGQLFVAEDLDPLGEPEVGGDDHRTPLVAVGEQVEDQFGAGSIEGHEAKLVNDRWGDPKVALLQALERTFVAYLDQLAEEVGAPDKGDTLPALC